MLTNSSSGFENAPLVALLRKPLDQMSPEETRAYVQELRTAQSSHQSLGKILRLKAAEETESGQSNEAMIDPVTGLPVNLPLSNASRKSKPSKKKASAVQEEKVSSFDDLSKELGF